MGRSGYTDDCDYDEYLSQGRWQAQVKSAQRGKRGQRFFRDLVAALDAMPTKRLVCNELETAGGEVCALGSLGRHRGIPMETLDTEDHEKLGETFDIARQLAMETMYVNDEEGPSSQSPEDRWERIRRWAVRRIVLRDEELLPLPDSAGEGGPLPDPGAAK